MKAHLLIRLVIVVGAIAISHPSFSSELSESEFRIKCTQAIGHEARALESFNVGEPLKVTDTYSIQVLRLKSRSKTLDLPVQLVLNRGSDSDAEIPKFAGVCLPGALPENFLRYTPPSSSNSAGDIEFYSKGYSSVTLSFGLMGLKHTTWRRTNGTGNDSVWMARYTAGSPVVPGPHDWGCAGKNVSINSANTLISFVMCHAVGSVDNTYEYALHMQQIGKEQFAVDIGIDPRIIDHPN